MSSALSREMSFMATPADNTAAHDHLSVEQQTHSETPKERTVLHGGIDISMP